ncbi:LysR substrate-binding domain-containing protein [Consotaella aegiceratis]|uniref:LysR substrate-binding domain-containing protein n=1 Tax=Consotaella aegiceratis TaxID=3097961 RepID=UPI002F3E877D
MELSWLEDFVELAAVRNFSVAAAARHVSQPAFSRRIRALENWVGAELIDRSSFPVSLTTAGETFLESGRELMREIYRLRDDCRQQVASDGEALTFSALHTIALSIFPDLLRRIEEKAGPFVTRMNATDFYDSLEALSLGRCEMALCYAHPLGPPVLQTGRFLFKKIAIDPFVLVSGTQTGGQPIFEPASDAGSEPLPLVSYSSDCFLGKIQAELVLQLRQRGINVRTVFENSMSEAVKRMVETGKGVGWLPLSATRRELADGRLIALEAGVERVELEVLVYRRVGASSPTMERFWAAIPATEPGTAVRRADAPRTAKTGSGRARDG